MAHQSASLAAARAIFLCLASCAAVCAQGYPDTLWIDVTFYDFHSDLSNPEFQADHQGGRKYGMVDSSLDADGKPHIGPQPYLNYYIKYWFRPWSSAQGGQGDFTIPNYTCLNNCSNDGSKSNAEIQYDGTRDVDYDTAFTNVVIEDSLPFIHTGSGVYEFVRVGQDVSPYTTDDTEQFFYIDGRGFGEEGKNHNFSFTMELHSSFTYEPGLTFEFNGDDDVWVFINGKLAMDLGGIHSPASDQFDVDDIAQSHGLEDGKSYSFDLFYAERHTVQSTIRITTNILAPPKRVRLYPTPQPGNNQYGSQIEWKAGEEIPVYAHVLDSNGTWNPQYDSLVTWELIDTMNNPGLSSTTAGPYTSWEPTEAFGTATVRATFVDPEYGDATTVTLNITVVPGDPDHVDIQADSSVASLRDDDQFDSLFIDEEETGADLFAVVRDRFGNYIRHATGASWETSDEWVVTVTRAADKSHGVVEKVGEGLALIIADESGLKPDSIKVRAMLPGTGLSQGITRDTDGNGYIDAIELHFDSLTTLPAGFDDSSLTITYQGHEYAILDISPQTGVTDSVFIVTLEEYVTKELQTGWTLTLSGKIPNVKPWRDQASVDGAAPVIQGVVHHPGWVGEGDTLLVTLSEPVNAETLPSDAGTVFEYLPADAAAGDVLENATVEPVGDGEYVTTVKIITGPDVEVYPFSDTMRVIGGATDQGGNTPTAESRKEKVGPGGDSRVESTATPNPFVPGVTTIKESMSSKSQEFYGDVIEGKKFGTVVGITTQKPLKPGGNGGYGSAAVYDAVGNLVVDGLVLEQAKTYRDYGVVWDGRNAGGRLVGSGGYLMVISATDYAGTKVVERMMVGVKR
ncbi:MAG: fibro-slime domain-containing protein [Chitinivibrionales bacterium]|nr:fibro-slime domain-containing protein [Chitinivibrionales bacterium]MBD3395976.1 fibro-slime domain-containing protein [Chitinivibrionales bacterium]